MYYIVHTEFYVNPSVIPDAQALGRDGMYLQLFSNKHTKRSEASKSVFLICLAFLLGISTYLLFSENLSPFFDENFAILNLDYRIFGCVLLLILVQVSSFSVIGSLFVFIFDYAFGLFAALSLDSIIPEFDFDVILILKLLLFAFVLVFALFSVSNGAIKSSIRFFRRLGNERTMKTEAVKLLAIILTAVIVSVIGFTDINIII